MWLTHSALPRRGSYYRCALLSVLGVQLACGAALDEQTRCSNGESIPLTIHSPHTVPTFAWARACPAWTLYVTYDDSNSTVIPVWGVSTLGSVNTIVSPVTFGVVPPGAQSSDSVPLLVVGRTYIVHVSGWNAAHGLVAFVASGGFQH